MKYIFLIRLFFSACTDKGLSPEEYFELCPYELKYGSRSHYLETPITVTPHQQTYLVGDTLTIAMSFLDSIFDLSRQVSFKIENFPFEPGTQLYRFTEEGWESGYRVNTLLVDEEKYNTRYNFQSRVSDDMRGFMVYENSRYHFEYQIVLETPGKYCTLISDQYESNKGSGNSDLNEAADNIQFEGRCPNSNFRLCSTIQGDPHYDEFLDELIYLDKEVYRDRLTRIEDLGDEHFGNGGIFIDWSGIFLFEVME